MKILVSGFEAFDGDLFNPSEQLVCDLSEKDHPYELFSVVLPVSFEDSFRQVVAKIKQVNPDVVLGFGLAKTRRVLSVERVAINWMEAQRPDNLGVQPKGERISADGPDGLFSNLPVNSLAQASLEVGVPSAVSNTAGTFVCNSLMYRLIEFCRGNQILSGFVHVPMTKRSNSSLEDGLTPESLLMGAEAILGEIFEPKTREETANFGKND